MKGNREQREINGAQEWLLPCGYLPVEEILTCGFDGLAKRQTYKSKPRTKLRGDNKREPSTH